MVVVLSGHLGLLMLLLEPAISNRNATPAARSNSPMLNLRFIRQPRLASLHLALPASQTVVSTLRVHAKPSRRPSEPLPVQRATHVTALPSETHLTSTPSTPNPYAGNKASADDGGFQKRLLNAQHSYAVRGVPGSDTPFAPGIHLADPMSQGIGAVMRKAQRLFGVTNRHCIDVEAWRQLTPQELSARHISPDDVDKVDEKYDCNRPPGLSF
ncbi:MAG TPA: hypothetical protein VIM06_10370 [Rhodanobacter sp.]